MQYDPDFSDPDVFHCPVSGCLVNVCNAMSSTPREFVVEIFQHVQRHDLGVNETEARALVSYGFC